MDSRELRLKFLKFFEKRGHKIIPSSSLIPENDSSVLFNIAGMQPLMPYLLGEKHPKGSRLVNLQKCIRTIDLDEVGDNTHLTFFEMMGNWSLGDYFKEEAIKWSYEFLTDKEEGLGLSKNRLYVTVFGGNEKVPKDMESVKIWEELGISTNRIYYKSSKSNWWSAGENSPAGPSTEMFYDITGNLGDMSQEEFENAEEGQKVVEIWNDVFMIYKQEGGQIVGELPKKNVDTGAGLERMVTMVQGKDSVYETDIFKPIIDIIDIYAKNAPLKYKRIIADHIRSVVFLLMDGVMFSNVGRGYVLRRLLRRAIVLADRIGLPEYIFGNSEGHSFLTEIKNTYEGIYNIDLPFLHLFINEEETKFRKTLKNGLKEFEKGTDPFILFTTFGFPIELTEELAKEKGIKINREDFEEKLKEHQKLSQTSSVGMFKGGLANHNENTIKLHTAHHLLLAGLKAVVDSSIKQKGSNINEERLRMDFLCDHKLTDEEKKKVEDWVNDKIKRDLSVIQKEIPLREAEKLGAEMEFGTKYPDIVSVYFIEENDGTPISKEFCGGPHVEKTGLIGGLKIQKEEAVSQGVRRIKAILI
ncbi:MAG: alanine--tRNA ligase [Candidatus Paceibacterota bacterium]|jgi:alanyl-tRNA synthetase